MRSMESPTEQRGRYTVQWTSQSTLKKVEIIDTATGRRSIGTHWASWDTAYRLALVQMLHPRQAVDVSGRSAD